MAKVKKDKLTRNDLEKPTHRPKDRTIRILQKARDELVCSGRGVWMLDGVWLVH
jgi:hypothetical protein